jgi:GNAT superfamily N-acetyltransferase
LDKGKNMNKASHLTEEQILLAGQVLEEAFFDDPLCVYTFPDPETRKDLFSWYFTHYVRQESALGNVSLPDGQLNGVAVWMPPHEDASMTQRSNPDEIEQKFVKEAYQRFTGAFKYFEAVHRQIIQDPHWYLELLGVAPHCQRQGIGKALLTPVLQRADKERLPCYLETFTHKNVPFYEQSNFHVVEAGIEPQSQISFWAMKRDPL